MEITKTAITIKDLCEGYVNETETDIEQGVYAYGGKLCVRPAFQRSFVYDAKQSNAVINTALKGFPLNIMYWVENDDGTYDCLDGQQRTISLANFVDGVTHFSAPWFQDGKKIYFTTLKRLDPDLYNKFLNYELEIYICKGTKAEQMDWFRTINIAGEKLYDQELRNANYVSPWLTSAKKYFSKANANSTAKCPAELVGGDYTNKNANRQELLEQVISWIVDSDEDANICQYMENHINDTDASELWNYYNDVIDWVKTFFDNKEKGLKSINWGHLYNLYKDEDINPDDITETFEKLIDAKASKELDISIAKIVEYCFSGDDTLLKHRAFSDIQKRSLYTTQKGCCKDCGKPFDLKDLHAHHIIPWYNGGTTDLANGVLLCKECHTQRHL